jgi:putative membrane protein
MASGGAIINKGQTVPDSITEKPSPERPRRSLRDYVGLVARGFCMGSADVVPGVSGGTMAFILGIYEELLESIRAIGRPEFLRLALSLRWGRALRVLNWPFLLAVASGIALAIISLARGLEWLLIHHPVLLWSFFFGLVLGSVLMVSRRVKRWRPTLWAALISGGVGAYLLVGLVPLHTPNTWWFLLFSGALAICAMILPGISGAFVLLLLGKYQTVLNAVNQRDIATLVIVMAGAAIGIVSFAQLLSWLFRRYHDVTVALLTGLMLGSLRKVWPWKITLEAIPDSYGELIPTIEQNVLPHLLTDSTLNPEFIAAIGLALAGFAVVVLLERWSSQRDGTTGRLPQMTSDC